MSKLPLLALLSVSIATLAFAQNAEPLTAEQDAVMKVETIYRLAKISRDTAALNTVLASDFYETNQNGNTRDKQETLALWKDFYISALTTDSFDVKVSGNTAVVRGTQTEGRGPAGEKMLFTRVYTKNANGWQLLSSMQARNPKIYSTVASR